MYLEFTPTLFDELEFAAMMDSPQWNMSSLDELEWNSLLCLPDWSPALMDEYEFQSCFGNLVEDEASKGPIFIYDPEKIAELRLMIKEYMREECLLRLPDAGKDGDDDLSPIDCLVEKDLVKNLKNRTLDVCRAVKMCEENILEILHFCERYDILLKERALYEEVVMHVYDSSTSWIFDNFELLVGRFSPEVRDILRGTLKISTLDVSDDLEESVSGASRLLKTYFLVKKMLYKGAFELVDSVKIKDLPYTGLYMQTSKPYMKTALPAVSFYHVETLVNTFMAVLDASLRLMDDISPFAVPMTKGKKDAYANMKVSDGSRPEGGGKSVFKLFAVVKIVAATDYEKTPDACQGINSMADHLKYITSEVLGKIKKLDFASFLHDLHSFGSSGFSSERGCKNIQWGITFNTDLEHEDDGSLGQFIRLSGTAAFPLVVYPLDELTYRRSGAFGHRLTEAHLIISIVNENGNGDLDL